ncbi:ACP S-malonyltransferase [Candidatus Berkiella cookevillensis]|uniref:Malonyl CoA-acyl carrier protein transacylase n=2 Tax=Candidatus Berkiella cookevillensis TaxID=437022 RepID=A0AAE3L4T6_9GAMM|nr:ACP S-malonyltransferase [Candidatus Berkiella cookevillensis]MCS5708962.1 ACP S-malonyltransferase [Candidatus Berkiella cookevillensis]
MNEVIMKSNFAFVFPGQGSQKIGMLKTFEQESLVRQCFEEASDVLGQNLWDLCQNGPEDTLNDTQWTQPLLLTASVALWRLWQEHTSLRPRFMIGHSLGEYSALVCAGSLSFSQAVALVQKRGQFMQAAVPQGQGAMAAILGMSASDVVALCKQITIGLCEAVNFNSPEQTVVAGEKHAVDALMSLAKSQGAKRALALPVSVPSHCQLMKPAAEQLQHYMQSEAITLAAPKITLLHNVDVQAHETQEAMQTALVKQLYQPVRWVESIEALVKEGIDTFVECGPGKVLGGLIKRIDGNVQSLSLETMALFEEAQNHLS